MAVSENGAVLLGGGAVVALLVLMGWLMVQESREWDAFASAHDCKRVAYISGEMMPTYGVGSNGQMVFGVTSSSGKTGWLCNDGITYYR
jgi:hypothetical protein